MTRRTTLIVLGLVLAGLLLMGTQTVLAGHGHGDGGRGDGRGERPQDGSGAGAHPGAGAGDCDEDGPHGPGGSKP